jgi:hypothetical protein
MPMTRPTDHIARPYDHNAQRNHRWDLLCGCRIVNAGGSLADQMLVTGELAITWCPTHAQAPAMLAFIKRDARVESWTTWENDRQAILRAVEG